jgi:hypothetical protein
MQTCHEGSRVIDPEYGAGVVVRVVWQGQRGLGGGSACEALVRFDGRDDVLPVAIEDLAPECDDNER